MSQKLQSEIIVFVNDLPYWQRYLAAYVLNKLDADQAEVLDQAYEYLLSAYGLLEAKAEEALSFPTPSDDELPGQIDGLKLRSVKDFKNVNAIRAGQSLPIATVGITALGGLNGAGKSSIGRLLNSACYSRGDDEILPNIFEPGDGKPASGIFVFEGADGKTYERTYVADGNHNHPEFSQFASFDTKCVNVHLNDENELHVAPRGFHFFREMADLTNTIIQYLNDDIGKISTVNRFAEHLEGESEVKNLISGLSALSEEEKIKAALVLAETDEQKITELNSQIADLNLKSIEAQRKELAGVKAQLTALKSKLAFNATNISEENLGIIKTALEKMNSLKETIEQKGAERFKESGIVGAGTDTWKLFLQSAQKLAHLQHPSYPESGDNCLFCAQTLDEKSAQHVQAYWDFLNSDAETQLATVTQLLIEKNTVLSLLDFSLPDDTSALAGWLTKSAPTEYETIKTCLRAQAEIHQKIQDALKIQVWGDIHAPSAVVVDELVKRVEAELTAVDVTTLTAKKIELETEVRTLHHKKKMAAKLPEILVWIAELKWLKQAITLRDSISTRAITDNGKRLFEDHVTKKYRQMFQQECTDLGARFRLDLVQRGRGGKSQRKYQIEGYPPGKILSEGEQRAVSLADFITELKISGINSGWIFDDPVNSQDIERKDLIAKKLVSEAKVRQIVVFSHDITFLYDLNGWAAELGVPFKCNWVERQGLDAGIIYEDAPPNFEGAYIDPDKAEKKLSDAKASDLGPTERENRVKEGFSCLRTSYEAFVVQKMLAKVVTRFDRRIGYHNIENIYAPPEWKSRVGAKLVKLSGYIEGHSHSDLNYKPITPDLLETEIEEFKRMKKEFDAERKAARKANQPQSQTTGPILQVVEE